MIMNDDLIVDEVRKAREEILESYGWDVEAMMRDMMTRQWKSGHTVVSMPRKKNQEGVAPNAYPLYGQG
jgi:hypothetical protein